MLSHLPMEPYYCCELFVVEVVVLAKSGSTFSLDKESENSKAKIFFEIIGNVAFCSLDPASPRILGLLNDTSVGIHHL